MSTRRRQTSIAARWGALAMLGFATLGPAAPVPVPKPADGDPPPPGALARLGSTRLRHTWTVAAVSFSADGKLLASCGAEYSSTYSVRVWEIPSGREVRHISLGVPWSGGHASRVALSPDGKSVAWSGLEGVGVTVADVKSGAVLHRFHKPEGRLKESPPLAFSADSKSLATGGSDGTLRVWNLTTGAQTLRSQVGPFDRCAFSPDRKTIAVAGEKPTGLRLIDATGKPQAALSPVAPHCFAFDPDGSLLAAGEDGLVRIWDVPAKKELRRIAWAGKSAFAVTFSPDGKTLTAVSRDGHVRTWTTATGKETRTFALAFAPGDRGTAERLALSADGRWLAAAPPGKRIRLVRLDVGRELPGRPPQALSAYGWETAFSPDGRHLVTLGDEDRLLVWEARTGKLVREGSEDARSVYWAAFTPDGKRILTLSYDRKSADKIRLDEWDFATCKRTSQRELAVQPGRVVLSADGKYLICGENNDVRFRMHPTGDLVLIDRATGKEVRRFDDGKAVAPQALARSDDGRTVATITGEGSVRVWDFATGKLLRSLEAGGSPALSFELRFTEGGKTLVSLSQGYDKGGHQVTRLAEWDVATGRNKKRGVGPVDMGWCHHLSPDGRLLAWSRTGERNEFHVWNVAESSAAGTFEAPGSSQTLLLFSPDGRTLASSSADDTIVTWDVPRPKKP